MANFPTSVWAAPTRNTGDVIQANFFNDPDNEIVALESQFINGVQFDVYVFTDLTKNLGRPSNRWLNLYTSALQALDVANRANFFTMLAAAAGADVQLNASGTDAVVHIQINPKGATGVVKIPGAVVLGGLGTAPLPSSGVRLPNAAVIQWLSNAGTVNAGQIFLDSGNNLEVATDLALNYLLMHPANKSLTVAGGVPAIPLASGLPTTTEVQPAGYAVYCWDENNKSWDVYSPTPGRWTRVSAFPTYEYVGLFPFR